MSRLCVFVVANAGRCSRQQLNLSVMKTRGSERLKRDCLSFYVCRHFTAIKSGEITFGVSCCSLARLQ
jgi:hypothetical protein